MEEMNNTEPIEEVTVVEQNLDWVDPNMETDLADLLNDTSVVEEPIVEPVVVEPVVIEPVVEPVVVEPVVGSTVVPVVPIAPTVEKPTELSEVDQLKATIERLTAALDKTSGPKPVGGSVADPQQVQSLPVQDQTVLNLLDMYKDVDLTEVMDSKEGFLKFMGDVLNAQASLTRKSVLSEIPQLVSPVVSTYNSQREIANEFYSRHPHLSKIKNYVSNVAVEVQARNQDKTLAEILELTATEVNEVIGFKSVQGTVEEFRTKALGRKLEPVLPGATGGVRTKPAPTNTLADEINDLISD
jgi:hypothetical protein